MGWLELIPLLKRLLPLLSRVIPMLDTFVAVRATSSKETEAALNRAVTDIKGEFSGEFAAAAESRLLLTKTLSEHTEHLREMNAEVERLRVATSEHDARMESIETHVAGLVRSLKTYAVIAMLLLILCTTLLVAMFLRR